MDRTEGDSLLTRTHTSLLEGLRDPADQTRWRQYVDRYRPLILGYATRLGLDPSEAEDVAQNVLLEFSKGYRAGRYDRDKGRLRQWLFGIVHHQVRNWQRRRRDREVQVQGAATTDFFAALPEPSELEDLWEREWQQEVLKQCFLEIQREVKPETFRAFHRFAVEGCASEQVAEELGMSRNAVFSAKRRVLARLRELRPLMDEIW